MSEFHVSDGLSFEHVDDGAVRLRLSKDGIERTIDKDTWASVVASVSAGGEIDGRYYAAAEFHASVGNVSLTDADTFEELLARAQDD